jgi:hypothetical protein
MNNLLHIGLTSLNSLLLVQERYAKDTDKAKDVTADYHQGLYNGLVISRCIFTDTREEPPYYHRQYRTKPNNRVRYKGKK